MSWRWDKKTTVEECRILSASSLHLWGIFKPKVISTGGTVTWKNSNGAIVSSLGYTFRQQSNPRLTLSYTITRTTTGEKQAFHYDIELVTTPCYFGGRRYWFICPLAKDGAPCRRRIAKMYLPPKQNYYGCRHCYNLTYESCQEHDARVDRLRKNPWMLSALINNGNPSLLAIKAAIKNSGQNSV